MKHLTLFLALVTLFSCGIDPKVEPTIEVVPASVISLESAGCTCPALPAGDWVLVPKL